MNKEPAIILGLVGALIALGVGFGLPVTPAQVGLIMAAVSAILAFVMRTQVVPTEKANAQIATAVRSPAGTTVEEVITKTERDSQ